MISDIKQYWRFLVVATSVLFLSFIVNLFGVVSTDYLFNRHNSSESLYGNQIVCGGDAYGGFLLTHWDKGVKKQLETCKLDQLEPYQSTFNLVGRVYSLGYKILHSITNISPFTYIKLMNIITALVTAAVLALFALWVRGRFGVMVAAVTVFLVAISTQLIANSVVTMAFLGFVPLVYTLYFYKSPDASKKYRVYFFCGLALLFCLKFLTNYEYITNYLIMIIAIVGYFLYSLKPKVKVYIKEVLLVSAVVVAGFVTALILHMSALAILYGSPQQALEVLSGKVVRRTSGDTETTTTVNPYRNLKSTAPEVYEVIDEYIELDERREAREALNVPPSFKQRVVDSLVSIINYASLPVVSIPLVLKEPFGTYIQSFAVFLLVLSILFMTRHKWVRQRKDRVTVDALFVSLAISFVGYISWHIAAHNHSLIHPHLNGSTMYIPLALIGYVVIGIYLKNLFSKKLPKSWK